MLRQVLAIRVAGIRAYQRGVLLLLRGDIDAAVAILGECVLRALAAVRAGCIPMRSISSAEGRRYPRGVKCQRFAPCFRVTLLQHS